MLEKTGDLASCPLMYAISTFSGKWKPFIVWYISLSPCQTMRYGALRPALPYKISHKMLTQHLRELEEDGILTRAVYDDEAIKRVEYSLTEKGRSLASLLYLLRDWGATWGDFDASSMQRGLGIETGSAILYKPPVDDDSDGEGSLGVLIWMLSSDAEYGSDGQQDFPGESQAMQRPA